MAVSSTYYLNGPSLGSATAVFLNAALTVCATDGFYSDGVIVRELVDCVLLPQQTCPSCEAAESYNCIEGTCIDPGDGSGTYSTLGACEAVCGEPPVELNVISVGGYMEPCSGGAIDDYMGAVVVLDGVVDVDTEFVVEVFYVDAGGTCGGTQFSQTLNVVILNGSDISNFNACTEGVNFPAGVVICGACISSCDNPNVSTTGFDCPL
jgi:hypothetical protein